MREFKNTTKYYNQGESRYLRLLKNTNFTGKVLGR